MAAKHRLFVFSKLESFAKARDEVKELLEECLGDRPDVDVTDYHNSAVGVVKKYMTITAAVVIDKRQTRCLITPSRRDKNVDHWDEFRTLYQETNPPGSILLFIYGDDWSRDENDTVSKKWFDIWRYNDTTAYELALRNRCFTLDKELNDKHRETLERYFSVVEKLALGEKNLKLKVFVAGNDRQSLAKYLEKHPFLRTPSPDDTTRTVYKSVFPPEVTGKQFYEEYGAKVYFLDLEQPVRVCDNGKKEFDRNVIQKLKFAKKKRSFRSRVCRLFTGPVPRRVIVFCHCADCCRQVMHDDSKDYKIQLDELYSKLRWQAFPVYDSITDGQDQGESGQSLQELKDEMTRFCTPGVVIEGEGKDKSQTGRSTSGCTSKPV